MPEYDRGAIVIVDWESPFVLRRGRRQASTKLAAADVSSYTVVDAWEALFFNILI